ncbi:MULTISPECIES: hypothetical protein [unclassified Aeromicrobium]|uniref:hypothetical protein n=1 Tax=unclassified Aeromicrobium TaxID=2633570 RepID=UPI00396B030A
MTEPKAMSLAHVNAAASAVLRGHLAEHRVTPKRVADAIGVFPAQFSGWMNDTKEPVSLALVIAVAEITGVEAAGLMSQIEARARDSWEPGTD